MINRSKLHKINYPNTTPVPEAENFESASREYYTYSDPDYEYMLYRTNDRTKVARDFRKRYVNTYGREEPSEQNSYNLSEEWDYRNLFDPDAILSGAPELMDRDVSPHYPFIGFWTTVMAVVEDYFFYIDAPISSLSLYNFIRQYLYFSEYTWPLIALYFPFLDYYSLFLTFGWDGFLEQNLFQCLFIFYLPFIVYLYIYTKLRIGDKLFSLPLFFSRFLIIFFTIFFFCVFLPITSVQTILFVPGLLFCAWLTTNTPVFETVAVNHYQDYYNQPFFQNLLPAPTRQELVCLPKYKYTYTYWSEPSNKIRNLASGQFSRFPFFKFKSLHDHIRRVKRIKLSGDMVNFYVDLVNGQPFKHFSYLESAKKNGVILDRLPAGYGYSPTDQYIYNFSPKAAAIDTDAESGERPDQYVADYITNEVGVSNIRFFSSELYHQQAFGYYNAVFQTSADNFNLFSPQAFNAYPNFKFGPYYRLAIWLLIIKPVSFTNETAGLLTNFSSTSFLTTPFFIRSNPLVVGANNTSSRHTTFISKYISSFLDFFYFVIVNKFFLFFFSYFRYRFNPRVSRDQTFNDFSFILSFWWIRRGILKELFRFLLFVNKEKATASGKNTVSCAKLFKDLVVLHTLLDILLHRVERSPLFYLQSRKVLYIRLCIRYIERTIFTFFLKKLILIMRYWRSNTIFSIVDAIFITHKSPIFLGYFWNFGVFAFLCLAIQLLTGLFLAIHYVSDTNSAFDSVEHIMRDVNNGWFLRYTHANGASFFFISVYIHVFRGLYYGSFTHPRKSVWYVGTIILFLIIGTAFLGYVLPWGQMSYWAATVITNLLSAIPLIGKELVLWVWGGYSVGGPTLTRFYALHYLLPWVILVLVFYHIYLLHKVGSGNPQGIDVAVDDETFFPYYIVKDLYAILLFFIAFAFVVFFYPNVLGHPDNYVPANPLVTPTHIVPEWYFLPFYAILRSIPDKMLGVFAMIFAIISIGLVPAVQVPNIRSMEFRPASRFLFWWFVWCCVILGWIGSQTAKYPYIEIGQSATFFYFFYFWILAPLIIYFENVFGPEGLPQGKLI